jgi:chemotaxis protein CheD
MEHGYEEHLAPNLYFDRTFNLHASKILPGEFYATAFEKILNRL